MRRFRGTFADETAIGVTSQHTPHSLLSGKTLLLGDTNLTSVRPSDVSEHCSIRTIKDGNIDLIKGWVSEKLTWTPDCCILYCGLQDILDDATSDVIFDALGSLVACLKQRNEDMAIYICEIAPVMQVEEYDEKINNYNNKLSSWSVENGVTMIKTNLLFRLGTGEVDLMCFDDNVESEGVFLNRYGILRLLNAVCKQCSHFKLCQNKEELYTDAGSIKISRNKGLSSNNYRRGSNTLQSRNYDSGNRKEWHNTGRDGISHPREFQGREHVRQPLQNRYDPFPTRPRYEGGYRGNEHRAYRSGHMGCFHCGERNHQVATCRFDHKLRCGTCEQLGHKSKFCPLKNQNRNY